MNYNIYFSPTGSTKKVTSYVSEQLGHYEEIDLSMNQEDYSMSLRTDDLCIVGVPSFGGRVPEIAAKRLAMLKGNQTPVVLIATYGNRAYEDTLIELKTVMNQNGFICIGACAIVCEHSIMHQYGKGRPTSQDYKQIKQFTQTIKERLQLPYLDVEVPGNIPYKKYGTIPLTPFATKKCTECGLCGKLCPIGAIPLDHPYQTDKDKCITCMRCVSVCPTQARKCHTLLVSAAAKKMKKACEVAKKNDFF